MYQSVGKYERAREYLEKSLAISNELGHRNGEASSCCSLGAAYHFVSENDKACRKLHLEKAWAIPKEIGNSNGKASLYSNLGILYQSAGEYEKGKRT